MRKRGWIRIVEVVIAILLIIGFLIFIYIGMGGRVSKQDYIYNLERTILEELSRDNSMREKVLAGDETDAELLKFIEDRLVRYNLNFNIRICPPEEACGLDSWPDSQEVYAEEILITSTLESYNPKKLKLFVWE